MMKRLLAALLLCLLAASGAHAQRVTFSGGGGGSTVTGGTCASGSYASAISTTGVPTCTLGSPPRSPGYPANTYQIGSNVGVVAGTAYSTASSIICHFAVYDAPFTVSGLMMVITTIGSSNLQAAMYTNDATTHRPGALVVNTPSFVDTSATAVNTAVSQGNTAVSAGDYWMCSNASDTAVVTTAASTPPIGSSSPGGVAAVASQVNSVTTAQAFGTWPSSLTAATFADNSVTTRARLVSVNVVSSP